MLTLHPVAPPSDPWPALDADAENAAEIMASSPDWIAFAHAIDNLPPEFMSALGGVAVAAMRSAPSEEAFKRQFVSLSYMLCRNLVASKIKHLAERSGRA